MAWSPQQPIVAADQAKDSYYCLKLFFAVQNAGGSLKLTTGLLLLLTDILEEMKQNLSSLCEIAIYVNLRVPSWFYYLNN